MIDLHRHLEGSIRAETLLEIAREFRVPRVSDDLEPFRRYVEMTPEDPRTFGTFLCKFRFIRALFVHRRAIERAAAQAVIDAADEGVRVLELRFSPVFFSLEGGFDPADAAAWVVAAAGDAARRRGVNVTFLATVARHLPLGVNEPTIDAAMRTGLFRGLDLAGDERADGLEYVPAFRRAADRGLELTIHAGELWGSGARVVEALDRFGARRIGHGTCALRDPRLMEQVAESGAVLEVCLTSNRMTGQVPDLSRHPVRAAADAPIVLGTDDPGIFRTTLRAEIELAASLGISAARAERTAATLLRSGAVQRR